MIQATFLDKEEVCSQNSCGSSCWGISIPQVKVSPAQWDLGLPGNYKIAALLCLLAGILLRGWRSPALPYPILGAPGDLLQAPWLFPLFCISLAQVEGQTARAKCPALRNGGRKPKPSSLGTQSSARNSPMAEISISLRVRELGSHRRPLHSPSAAWLSSTALSQHLTVQ